MLFVAGAVQAAVYALPWGPKPQFVDANGAPMSSGTISTFIAGSTTAQVTYTDSTGGVANPTTITLNVRGETPNEVWLTGGVSYKLVLKDSSGSTIWTVDNIAGVNDTTGSQSEWIAGPAPTYVSATSFTLVGDQTTTFTVGRRLKTTNSGGTVYSTIVTSVFGASTTVTVVNDSSTLDSGLSAVSYGLLQATNKSVPPFDGVTYLTTVAGTNTITASAAKSTAPLVTGQNYSFIPANNNTAATTLNINGLGAKNVFNAGAALAGGELKASIPSQVIYDGTQFNLVSNGVNGAPGSAQTFLGGDVALNNTANYFNIVNTGSIGASGQVWVITANITITDTAGAATVLLRIWDGSSAVYVEVGGDVRAANATTNMTAVAVVTLSAATTFHASSKDLSSTSGAVKTTGNAGTANKATSITAIRLQ